MPIIILFYKYSNKRARNLKLASKFFKASAEYIRGLPQISKKYSPNLQQGQPLLHTIKQSYHTLTFYR